MDDPPMRIRVTQGVRHAVRAVLQLIVYASLCDGEGGGIY
jgi:hypothetical protein